ITGNGAALCWGNNAGSQLGSSGGPSANPVPTAVSGGRAFRTLVAGDRHSCGIGSDSLTYCWGANDAGQLGDSQPGGGGPSPVLVATRRRYVSLAAGGEHTCGVNAALAYCWGANDKGQLGDSSFTDRAAPAAVYGAIHFSWITAGDAHTCAFATSGAVYCWGDNGDGQLGDHTTTNRPAPALVTP